MNQLIIPKVTSSEIINSRKINNKELISEIKQNNKLMNSIERECNSTEKDRKKINSNNINNNKQIKFFSQ